MPGESQLIKLTSPMRIPQRIQHPLDEALRVPAMLLSDGLLLCKQAARIVLL